MDKKKKDDINFHPFSFITAAFSISFVITLFTEAGVSFVDYLKHSIIYFFFVLIFIGIGVVLPSVAIKEEENIWIQRIKLILCIVAMAVIYYGVSKYA